MNSGDATQVTTNATAARGVKFQDTDAPGASQVKVFFTFISVHSSSLMVI